MMRRDDMLRELELLPVWKLRAPVKTPLLEPVIAEPNITAITEALPAVSADLAPAIFEIMLSQDKNWAFIYKPADRTDIGLQGILLNNILQALHIDKPIQSTAQNLSEINAQLIVAMGESVAQTLLNSQNPIENLRGQGHS